MVVFCLLKLLTSILLLLFSSWSFSYYTYSSLYCLFLAYLSFFSFATSSFLRYNWSVSNFISSQYLMFSTTKLWLGLRIIGVKLGDLILLISLFLYFIQFSILVAVSLRFLIIMSFSMSLVSIQLLNFDISLWNIFTAESFSRALFWFSASS